MERLGGLENSLNENELLDEDRNAAIMLLCRAVSRLFINKLIQEKISDKKTK